MLLVSFCHVVHPFCIDVELNALLRLVVDGVLLAESAILLHLETVRVILLVLHGVVVSLLALRASHSDFYAHYRHLLNFASLYIRGHRKIWRIPKLHGIHPRLKMGAKKRPLFTGEIIVTYLSPEVNYYFLFFCILSYIFVIRVMV